MPEYITRRDGDYPVAEELANEALAAVDEHSIWFRMPEGWEVDGDTVTALLGTYLDEGGDGPERFKLTMTVERLTACVECHETGFHKMDCSKGRGERR